MIARMIINEIRRGGLPLGTIGAGRTLDLLGWNSFRMLAPRKFVESARYADEWRTRLLSRTEDAQTRRLIEAGFERMGEAAASSLDVIACVSDSLARSTMGGRKKEIYPWNRLKHAMGGFDDWQDDRNARDVMDERAGPCRVVVSWSPHYLQGRMEVIVTDGEYGDRMSVMIWREDLTCFLTR